MQNKYELILIHDDTTTMQLWNENIKKIYEIIEDNINLTQLSSYRIKSDKILSLENNKGDLLSSTEFNDIHNNKIILFITNGVSTNFDNYSLQTLLTQIAEKNIVNIINLMPKKDWNHLGTKNITATSEIGPNVHNNKEFKNDIHNLIFPDEKNDEVAIPMVENKIEDITTLINTIIYGGKISAITFNTNPTLIDEYKKWNQMNNKEKEQLSAQEKILRYRAFTPKEAYQLAIYLSPLDFFNIDDIKIIQNHMLENKNVDILNYLFLGGLIEPLNENILGNIEGKWKFKEGVADRIIVGLRQLDELKIRELLPQLSIMKNITSEEKNKLKINNIKK